MESERAFERLQLTQTSMLDALAFGTFLNAALILTSGLPVGAALTLPARISWGLASLFGLRIPLGLFKVSGVSLVFDGARFPREMESFVCGNTQHGIVVRGNGFHPWLRSKFRRLLVSRQR